MRYRDDHPSLVLFNKGARGARPRGRFAEGVLLNQISWQVGSLEEGLRGDDW